MDIQSNLDLPCTSINRSSPFLTIDAEYMSSIWFYTFARLFIMNPRQASKDHPAEQDVLLEGRTSDKGKYLASCTNLYCCVTTDHKLAVASSALL